MICQSINDPSSAVREPAVVALTRTAVEPGTVEEEAGRVTVTTVSHITCFMERSITGSTVL
jgi:hypothetical protein